MATGNFYIKYIFLIPVIILIAVYIVLRVNLRRAAKKTPRRQPSLIKIKHPAAASNIVFWPREKDMPDLRHKLRADMGADPQLGPLIMIISSNPVFSLLCILNLVIGVICLDALFEGVLFMKSLTYGYLDLATYRSLFGAILILMLVWGGVNIYRAFTKILFYEHGITLMPWQNTRYAYNDIEKIEIVSRHGLFGTKTMCRISLKNNRELVFDSSRYAKFNEQILFWKQNLVWAA